MNEQEQRIAIADVCGERLFVLHKPIHDPFGYYRENARGYTSDIRDAWKVTKEVGLKYVNGTPQQPDRVVLEPAPLPDYLHDLNAIHVAVMAECEKRGYEFQAALDYELQCVIQRRRTSLNREQIGFWMNWATSAQRAEAFLRTIGKWRND